VSMGRMNDVHLNNLKVEREHFENEDVSKK
jgi:hypothetical protein